MPETLNTRVTRLEEAQIKLTNAMTHLAEVQAQDEGELRQMNVRIEQMKIEALEREKRIDERIDKLVVAIGELISRNGKSENK